MNDITAIGPMDLYDPITFEETITKKIRLPVASQLPKVSQAADDS
jgi:hypothetical protein